MPVPVADPLPSATPEETYTPEQIQSWVDAQAAMENLNSKVTPEALDQTTATSSFDQAQQEIMGQGPIKFTPPSQDIQYRAEHANDPTPPGAPVDDTPLTPAQLNEHIANQWEDPMWHPHFEQWKEVHDLRHQLGKDTFSYGLSKAPGVVGDMIQSAWGGLQEFGNSVWPDDGSNPDGAALASTGIESVRRAAINSTKLAMDAARMTRGLTGSDSGLTPEQRIQQKYNDFMADKAFDREIVQPTMANLKPVGISQPVEISPRGMGLPQPLPNAANLGAMILAPENMLAGAAGKMVAGSGFGNVVKGATGRVFTALGNKGVAVDQGIANAATRFSNAVEDRTGFTLPQIRKGAEWTGGVMAAGGLTTAAVNQNPDLVKALMLPVALYAGFRTGAAVLRPTSRVAQATGAIFREAADPLGPLRAQAVQDLAGKSSTWPLPKPYTDALRGNASGISSTPSRIANNTAFPAWERRMGQRFSGPVTVGTVRTLGKIGEGAVGGIAGMIPMMAGANDAGDVGKLIGSGAIFGAGGGLVHNIIGSGKAMIDQDVARFLVDTHMAGGDVARTAQLPTDRLQRLAALQGLVSAKGVSVIPLNGKDYAANVAGVGGGTGSAGIFIDRAQGGNPRIYIDLDAKSPAEMHEIGEAINSSQVMGGKLRRDIRNWVNQKYGTERVIKMGREYVQRSLEAEDRAAVKLKQPVPTTPMQDRVTDRMAKVQAESLADPARDAMDPMDWARDEIWAEHVNTSGLNFNDLRANMPQGGMLVGTVNNLLAGASRALNAIGVPIHPQTGAVKAPMSRIFRDNPLINATPELQRQVANYISTYNGWLNGVEEQTKGKKPQGTRVSPTGNLSEVINSPYVKMHEGETPGVTENEFLRTKDGVTTPKTQKEIDQAQAERDAQLNNLYDPNKVLDPRVDPTDAEKFGPRKVNGRVQVGGPNLPPGFFDANKFPKWIREFCGQLADGQKTGTVWRALYHAIGRGDSGSFKIHKLGNFEAIQRDIVPFYYFKSAANKLLVNVMDVTALKGKMFTALNAGKLGLFGHDLDQFRTDLAKYFDNHKQGLPGANGIGSQKEAVINGMLFTDTNDHRLANPLYREFGDRGVIRSFRLDRLEDLQPALDPNGQPQSGFHFDYDKVKFRAVPDVVDPTIPPEEHAAPRAMPDTEDADPALVPSPVNDEHDNSRIGTALQGKVRPTTSANNVGIDTVDSAQLQKQMNVTTHFDKDAPLPKSIMRIKDPAKKAEAFIELIKTNLLALHDEFPAELRARATQWYDGARKIAENIAQKSGLTNEQSAAIMAAFSPMKDWFQNVAMAERFSNIFANHLDTVVSRQDHADAIKAITKSASDSSARKKIMDRIVGKSIRELWQEGNKTDAAWAARVIAQQVHGLDHDVLAPEGYSMGTRLNNNGRKKTLVWQSSVFIKKALEIGFDGSPENISKQLGAYHKIRSFYNNIIAPNSPKGDATIDTHAVNAGALFPMGNKGKLVNQNFGGAGVAGGGNTGTYWLWHEAYKRAAAERGLLPRQMQSITWEAVRGLFPDNLKGTKEFYGKVRHIWENAKDENDARKQILALGIRRPEWARSDSGSGGRDTGSTPVPRRGAGKKVNLEASGGAGTGPGSGPGIADALDTLTGKKAKRNSPKGR